MTRLEALNEAERLGFPEVSSMGGPGHRFGCRLFDANDWLIGRGATWAEVVADLKASAVK